MAPPYRVALADLAPEFNATTVLPYRLGRDGNCRPATDNRPATSLPWRRRAWRFGDTTSDEFLMSGVHEDWSCAGPLEHGLQVP